MAQETSILKRIWRWTLRTLVVVVALLALVTATGCSWQAWSTWRDAKLYPPPGELVDIGGRSLHLVCMGEGSPTILIESGAQDWSTGWRRPQQAMAAFTQVCSYDRAGIGWSEPSSDPKDGLHMVADLHALLEAARIEPPVVLVGHSLGGMLNRIYYSEYPNQVAGMVLAEPGDPDLVQEMFPESPGEVAFGSWVDTLASMATRVGLVRWFYRDLFEGKGYPDGEVARTRARIPLPASTAALASTVRHLPVTAAQTRRNESLGEIPLIVVRSTKFDEVGTSFENEEERQQFRGDSIAAWDKLGTLSTRGRPTRVVEGANHITLVREDEYWPEVVAAVEQVVGEARTGSEL